MLYSVPLKPSEGIETMLARHVPPRFSHNRAAWFARMAIVATRKAEKAAAAGRDEWAKRWRAAAYCAKEGYHENREESF
jgi:hypothetical protein